MKIQSRGFVRLWLPLLLSALLAVAAGGRGWAHVCPVGPAVPITFPADGATVSGEFNVQVIPTPPASGFTVNGWDKAYLFVMDPGSYPGDDAHTHLKVLQSNPNETGPWWTDLNTTTLPNGDYWLFSYSRLIPDDYYTMRDSEPCDYGLTTYITIHVNNPDTTRMYPSSSMDCPCRCDGQQTGSITSPLTGHQSWGVPITSW